MAAENVAALIQGAPLTAHYDGYGSCPLTVEKGKVVLAEFGYDGKLLPTFPLLDATQPSRLAWWLKAWFYPGFIGQACCVVLNGLPAASGRDARSVPLSFLPLQTLDYLARRGHHRLQVPQADCKPLPLPVDHR